MQHWRAIVVCTADPTAKQGIRNVDSPSVLAILGVSSGNFSKRLDIAELLRQSQTRIISRLKMYKVERKGFILYPSVVSSFDFRVGVLMSVLR